MPDSFPDAPDDEPDRPPPDLHRYITPAGAQRFRAEQAALWREERPRIVEIVSWAAGNGDRSENGDYQYGKRRLREIDRRLRFLARRLRHAIVVDPAATPDRRRVLFGATVFFAADDGDERTVTLVGVDEADGARGEVSLISPIARALLGRVVGDEVILRLPAGPATVEVLGITYP